MDYSPDECQEGFTTGTFFLAVLRTNDTSSFSPFLLPIKGQIARMWAQWNEYRAPVPACPADETSLTVRMRFGSGPLTNASSILLDNANDDTHFLVTNRNENLDFSGREASFGTCFALNLVQEFWVELKGHIITDSFFAALDIRSNEVYRTTSSGGLLYFFEEKVDCGEQSLFVYEMVSDGFPAEVSWNIRNSDGKVVVSNPFAIQWRADFLSMHCLDAGTYTFTISDPDGIDEPGFYRISSEGQELARGGSFSGNETTSFAVMGLQPTSTPSTESSIQTNSPTGMPVLAPVVAPTPTPSEVPSQTPTGTPPVASPTGAPVRTPSASPSKQPVPSPSGMPSPEPPTSSPITPPTSSPTTSPTMASVPTPTMSPTRRPIPSPTGEPSLSIPADQEPSTSSPVRVPEVDPPTLLPTNVDLPADQEPPTSLPVSVPVLSPVVAPVPAPTRESPPTPTVINTVMRMICFSNRNTVLVRGIGQVPMDEVKVGDWVEVGRDTFEPVYSFCKHSHTISGEFLQIYTAELESPVELSGNHLLFLASPDKQGSAAIPASEVQIGDMLVHGDGTALVTEIHSVERRGVYAPYTASGSIVVNGILASNYATIEPILASHDALHFAQAHHRLICRTTGFCKYESYAATTGLSNISAVSMNIYEWWTGQFGFIHGAVSMALLGGLSLAYVLDCVLQEWTTMNTSSSSIFYLGCLWLVPLFVIWGRACRRLQANNQGKQ